MKKHLQQCLGFLVPVWFYESFEEADRDAGKEGAALHECNMQLYLRGGTAQELREAVAEQVETLTKVERKTRPVMVDKKDKDGKVEKGPDGKAVQVPQKDDKGETVLEFAETEADYVQRALTTKGLLSADGKVEEAFATQIVENINSAKDDKGQPVRISVSLKPRERKAPKPKTLAKEYLENATKALADKKKLDAFGKLFKQETGRALTTEETTSAEKLGWAIKFYFDEKTRKSKESLAAAFGA